MRKVLVFGAFDGLHPGHLDFFKQAKEYGDYLVVSIGTDKNVEKIKNKKALFNQYERLTLVKNCRLVDEAVIGAEENYFDHIKEISPDVICLGYDQWAGEDYVKKELKDVNLDKTEVVRLSAFEPNRAKSSIIKLKSVDRSGN